MPKGIEQWKSWKLSAGHDTSVSTFPLVREKQR
jgi:hypothetical protein